MKTSFFWSLFLSLLLSLLHPAVISATQIKVRGAVNCVTVDGQKVCSLEYGGGTYTTARNAARFSIPNVCTQTFSWPAGTPTVYLTSTHVPHFIKYCLLDKYGKKIGEQCCSEKEDSRINQSAEIEQGDDILADNINPDELQPGADDTFLEKVYE